ncbi:hypothetical protein AUJ14_05660 [Candidatus Micrarchaeota archaeon CG1_02_55_22]|nr:MAG: hypothetical protein AUJ14_05660 [Candidatus Micrarchaeota archaeon CG1_02_55_22]
MADEKETVAELRTLVTRFRDERDWQQFYSPKELSVSLCVESAELLEHFQWKTDEEIRERLNNPAKKREAAHELADCLWSVLLLSDELGIDLSETLKDKITEAAKKYPTEKVKGKNKKYDEY